MSNPFYKLLETFDELDEDMPTKVKKIGNQIEVDDGAGNKTMYDEKTWDEMHDDDGNQVGVTEGYGDDYETDPEFDNSGEMADTMYTDNEFDIDSASNFNIDDDDIGMDFNFEAEEDDFEPADAVVDDNLFSDPNYSSDYDSGGWGDELGDDDIGMDFNFEAEDDEYNDNEFEVLGGTTDSREDEFFGGDDDFDAPDYETFDLKTHGKRLRPGTPIMFSDDIGGGEGTFIEKSPSGAFGTAERNGKTISIHLNDIEEADLQNSSIYENFEKQFNKVMEDVTVVRTNNSDQPENDTITITGTGEHTEMLSDIMHLAGMEGGDGTELPQDAEIPVNVDPSMEPEMGQGMGMQDMMSMIDTAEQPPISGAEEMESIREDEDDEAKSKMDRLRKPWSMPPFKSKGSKGISKDKSGTGEFQGEKQNAAYVPKNGNDEDTDIEEGISDDIQKGAKKAGKWLKRGLQGWDMDYADPKDMQQKHNEYDTDSLHNLDDMHDNMKGGETKELGHSPHDLQQKLINRELRRRGERDFKKYGDSRKMTDDVEEDYSNEPDEVEATVDAQVNGMSGGINGRKKHWRKEYPGDNIMSANLEEAAEKITDANSKEGFLNLYKVINDISNAS